MGTTLTLGFFSRIHETDIDAFDVEDRVIGPYLDFLHKRYDIWARIHDLEPKQMPWPVELLTANCGGEGERTREDIRGAPLTYVRAGELAALGDSFEMNAYDAAIFAYLAALPMGTIVTLWWS